MTAGLFATNTIHRHSAKADEEFYWSNPEIHSPPRAQATEGAPSCRIENALPRASFFRGLPAVS